MSELATVFVLGLACGIALTAWYARWTAACHLARLDELSEGE